MQRPVLKAPSRPSGRGRACSPTSACSGSLLSVAGLTGAPVVHSSGVEVGHLVDAVVRWEGEPYPPMTGLVVRSAVGRPGWPRHRSRRSAAARSCSARRARPA